MGALYWLASNPTRRKDIGRAAGIGIDFADRAGFLRANRHATKGLVRIIGASGVSLRRGTETPKSEKGLIYQQPWNHTGSKQ